MTTRQLAIDLCNALRHLRDARDQNQQLRAALRRTLAELDTLERDNHALRTELQEERKCQ
jgi:cell shape-determining protein MreC